MPTNLPTTSIKKSIVYMVTIISGLSLLLTLSINGWIDLKDDKETQHTTAISFATMIATSARQNVISDKASLETERLMSLKAFSFIENVHIYKIDHYNGELDFFASYNKKGTPPVPAKFGKIKQLSTPYLGKNYLELVKPILVENNIIGYLYLRGSLKPLNTRITYSFYSKIIILITAVLISFVLALRFQKHITNPIQELVSLYKRVANDKDYTLRAPPQNLKELSVLNTSFNIMLDRIHGSLEKKQSAEDKIRKLNQSLEDKVEQRTNALKDANNELLTTLEKLHQYQNQLVENEKMASLGDMVAGVAHEVNTPIGLGVTASTLMLDRISDIRGHLDGKSLTAKQLDKFLADGEENLNIIYRNLNRAAELISSFKQVAVDQGSETNREFCVNQLIQEVLISLQPKLKNFKHEFIVDCDQTLKIESKPGPLNQVLINLIMNSIIHGFENNPQGVINISVRNNEDHVNIIYTDNGKGINQNLIKRIFDPFVTTKRGEGGSGLGMHLVYNLITQGLKGNIIVNSEEGEGVTFNINFPAKIL